MTAVYSRILREPGEGLGAGGTSSVRNLARNRELGANAFMKEERVVRTRGNAL